MNKFHVIIPARFQSTRLPAKALSMIGNKTMIEHVCAQAELSGAESVTVATDSDKILSVVDNAGFKGVITSDKHLSGSDRVFEAAELIGLSENDIIVNVQGDEPFIPPDNISLVASLLNKEQFPMATLCCQIHSSEEALDPNVVKVVFDYAKKALYFSRSLIPFNRDKPVKTGLQLIENYYRHIGIYAYRKSFLKQFIQWPQSELEKIECLEQLRVLENGGSIGIANLENAPPPGIDTPEDLEVAQVYFEQLGS